MLAYNESRDTYFEIRKDNCVGYDQLANTVLRKDPVNCKASPAHRICRFLSIFVFSCTWLAADGSIQPMLVTCLLFEWR